MACKQNQSSSSSVIRRENRQKIALTDKILLQVQKPARYVGGEVNSVIKDPSGVDIRFAFAFPDVYDVGMSHLGMQMLYNDYNRYEYVYLERCFAPWVDMEEQMRSHGIPLYTLETFTPVREFDFIGFTLQYEMSFTNILNMLDLGHIPLYSADRSDEDPLVCAGGSTGYNPEPLSPFIDFFYMGEGEVAFGAIFERYREHKKAGKPRREFLEQLASIPGIYVPAFYTVTYEDRPAPGCEYTPRIQSVTPNRSSAPATVRKLVCEEMDQVPYPTKPLIPYLQTVHDRAVLEIFRGCIRGCRFCQAGMVYRPVRMRSKKNIMELADAILKNTGYDEISFTSLSSNDYPNLFEMIEEIHEKYPHINVSLPSLRVDAFSLDLMERLSQGRKSGLTFAAEAGTQRLRDVINKGITQEEIETGVHLAFSGGWNKVKLYFMLGLPTETETDIAGIATLAEAVVQQYYNVPKEQRAKDLKVTVSTSFFVPKPFSPFQWAPQSSYEEYMDKQQFLQGQIHNRKIQYNCHDAFLSTLEGYMARGDRRTADLIYAAWKNGCRFDSWSDMFNEEAWKKAIEECHIERAYYITRERDRDEVFPWDHIDVGVTKSFLYREYERSQKGIVTPNCRQQCSGCGAMRISKKGICYGEEEICDAAEANTI